MLMQYRICARFLPFRWLLARDLLIVSSIAAVTIRPTIATTSSCTAFSRERCFSSSVPPSSSSCISKMSDKAGESPAEGESYQAGSSSVAFVTTPDRETARKLARSIIERKLAACVNIVPQIESIYLWEGKVNEDSECLLMVKTRTSRIDELSKFVRENHPYSVAEVISLPIQNGNPPYLDWIAQTVPEQAAYNQD
ncbi:protein CutA homolog [Drosophila rhopaloa]|uniref:Protein CutA homolog n=1 Tax=Drosophila rhopaloa TaxID=1041015 RepID=A0A6P4E149_DRORH|nr:protein CutA homolog [Drosophila rhopaloa]